MVDATAEIEENDRAGTDGGLVGKVMGEGGVGVGGDDDGKSDVVGAKIEE